MIKRIWHGWTRPEDADRYERLLLGEIIPAILDRKMHGFRGIEVLRAEVEDEVEFITIMTFVSRDAVGAFVGDDIEVAHVPEAAQRILSRWDRRSRHYDVRDGDVRDGEVH